MARHLTQTHTPLLRERPPMPPYLLDIHTTNLHSLVPFSNNVPEYMEVILGVFPGDVWRCLGDLGLLIECKANSKKLRILHSSLFDFTLANASNPFRQADGTSTNEKSSLCMRNWCVECIEPGIGSQGAVGSTAPLRVSLIVTSHLFEIDDCRC